MTPRKHNPAWKDATRNERQQRRQAALNQAAQVAGFASWSAFETAIVNGATVTVSLPDGGDHGDDNGDAAGTPGDVPSALCSAANGDVCGAQHGADAGQSVSVHL